MTKYICRGQAERVKMGHDIGKQLIKVPPVMIMRDHLAGDSPEPLNTIGVWIL